MVTQNDFLQSWGDPNIGHFTEWALTDQLCHQRSLLMWPQHSFCLSYWSIDINRKCFPFLLSIGFMHEGNIYPVVWANLPSYLNKNNVHFWKLLWKDLSLMWRFLTFPSSLLTSFRCAFENPTLEETWQSVRSLEFRRNTPARRYLSPHAYNPM